MVRNVPGKCYQILRRYLCPCPDTFARKNRLGELEKCQRRSWQWTRRWKAGKEDSGTGLPRGFHHQAGLHGSPGFSGGAYGLLLPQIQWTIVAEFSHFIFLYMAALTAAASFNLIGMGCFFTYIHYFQLISGDKYTFMC